MLQLEVNVNKKFHEVWRGPVLGPAGSAAVGWAPAVGQKSWPWAEAQTAGGAPTGAALPSTRNL